MFTGLIEAIGTVRHVRPGNKSVTLGIAPDSRPYEVTPGDSLAVNGVCLTVEMIAHGKIVLRAVRETLSKTTLASLVPGSRVNLERALGPTGRMGGHIVQGHVDGVGRVLGDTRAGDSVLRSLWMPEDARAYLAPKGAVAIDGVSLTIANTHDERIDVSLVPYTLLSTTLGAMRPGDAVNVECDVLARYVRHMSTRGEPVQAASGSDTRDTRDLLSRMETLGF
ncbi:MAG: riboflavin synthase [Chitinivibrionales bacterium]|nr:riboflavin synthase [Chitinivibrionales bacterium]MBD3396997.1 riboflavin synthase [Chitinivibrionales bacterium]